MIVEYATRTVEQLVTSDWSAQNPVRPEISVDQLEALRRSIDGSDAVRALGFDVQLLEEGVVEILVYQSTGEDGDLLGGGVLLSLLDCATTAAAQAVLGGADCGTTRVETSFLRPFATPLVTAHAWVTEVQGGVAMARAVISDDQGPVAVAEAIVVDVSREQGVMSSAA